MGLLTLEFWIDWQFDKACRLPISSCINIMLTGRCLIYKFEEGRNSRRLSIWSIIVVSDWMYIRTFKLVSWYIFPSWNEIEKTSFTSQIGPHLPFSVWTGPDLGYSFLWTCGFRYPGLFRSRSISDSESVAEHYGYANSYDNFMKSRHVLLTDCCEQCACCDWSGVCLNCAPILLDRLTKYSLGRVKVHAFQ